MTAIEGKGNRATVPVILRPYDTVRLLGPLYQGWKNLRERAVATAVLNPRIENFIVLPWVNKYNEQGQDLIDHNAEIQAAEILACVSADIQADCVLAIGNSGLSLGKAAGKLAPREEYVEALKLNGQPPFEGFATFKAYSYSMQQEMQFQLPRVLKGKRVRIRDDVVAQAHVAKGIIKAVQEQGGKVVEYGVYFDKAFQGGLQEIADTYGIACFSVIRIAGIRDGKIELMEESQALRRL